MSFGFRICLGLRKELLTDSFFALKWPLSRASLSGGDLLFFKFSLEER